jgi:uncharacterized membrane protein
VRPHPPLYFLLLQRWIELGGASEFSVRYVSVFVGTLVTPLLFLLAKHLGNSVVGIFAAFFVALSPLQVYYSQGLVLCFL